QSRYGKLTSIRVRSASDAEPASYLDSFRRSLRAALQPDENGLSVTPVRTSGVEVSRGATDFGEYFVYFSFFLVIGALLLASLFFKLGIEQRLREIGTLRAIGFPAAAVRSLFVREGVVLAISGSALGVAGAVGYGALLMYGLRTWWVDAVGTTVLRLHVSGVSLLIGAVAGTIVALLCIVWTLRRLAPASPSSLLTGSLDAVTQSESGSYRQLGRAAAPEAERELGGTTRKEPDRTGSDFGAPTEKQRDQAPYPTAIVNEERGMIEGLRR